MNKTDLIDAIATAADLPKASAGRALDAVIDSITQALKNNDQRAIIEQLLGITILSVGFKK